MAATSLVGLLGQAIRHPGMLARMLPGMLRASWRFRARGWWRRPPFLPLPPREYLRWRLHTAYGDEGRSPTPVEVSGYLRWANRMYAARRSEIRVR